MTRVRLRHVLVTDGPRAIPGWYVVDTAHRPPPTLAGPFDTRAEAEAALARWRGVPVTAEPGSLAARIVDVPREWTIGADDAHCGTCGGTLETHRAAPDTLYCTLED